MGALGLHGGPLPLGWITKLEGCAGLRMCQNTSKPREGVAHGCSSRRNGVLQGDRDGLDCRSCLAWGQWLVDHGVTKQNYSSTDDFKHKGKVKVEGAEAGC